MRVSLLIAFLCSFVMMGSSGEAITFGEPDGNGHPHVGALLFIDDDGAFPYCSGTLIAPQVFLTAAHCDIQAITGTDQVAVTFDPQIVSESLPTVYTGTFVPHAQFSQAQNDPHDIAVVLLDVPLGLPLAQLPTAGQFDTLQQTAKDQQFTAVGYGGEEPIPIPGSGVVIGFLDTRQVAISSLNAVTKAWLHLSQNPATGDGGTCYGDSGGPNFLGAGANETNVIAGLTITGDAICRATNVIYRLDTAVARAFLGLFGVLLP
jgi:secreted trypsin-like serine protease